MTHKQMLNIQAGGTECSFTSMRWISIALQSFFDITVLQSVSRHDLLPPLPTSANKFDESWSLVRLTAKRDLPQQLDWSVLAEYVFFVNQAMSSRRKPIISWFERWVQDFLKKFPRLFIIGVFCFESISPSCNFPVNKVRISSVNQPMTETNQSSNQSISETVNCSINRPTNQSRKFSMKIVIFQLDSGLRSSPTRPGQESLPAGGRPDCARLHRPLPTRVRVTGISNQQPQDGLFV